MLRRFSSSTALCALLASSGAARALPVGEAAAARQMTLVEALAYARVHQPQVRSALAEVRARLAEAQVPRAQWFPQVGATAQVFYGTANNTTALYLAVPEADLPRIGATKAGATGAWTPSPSTIVAASLDQEVYDFGRIAAQAAVADALAEETRAGAEVVALDVQLGVEEAYHGVLAGKEVLRATDEALRRAVTHRDYAQAGVRTGLRPPIELTRAEADVAQLEVRKVRAESSLQIARAAFAAAIGSDALEIDAAPLAPGESPTPAFAEALRAAVEKNPIVAQAIARLAAQRYATTAIGRELLPNLLATAGLSARAGGAVPSSGAASDVPTGGGWLPDVPNWFAGLVLQWNVFDATVLARRQASQAREEAAQADFDLARMNATLLAQRAWLDLDAATRALPGLESALKAAQANQAQADARFKAGIGNVVELADAEALLINAELELAIGRFNVARARAQLGRAMGEHENGRTR